MECDGGLGAFGFRAWGVWAFGLLEASWFRILDPTFLDDPKSLDPSTHHPAEVKGFRV